MAVQIYCTEANIISIIGEPTLNVCIDDDSDGVVSGDDAAKVTACIERAAVEMNSALANQYVLSELASNEWCKWCNAYLAVYYLSNRRRNPVPLSVGADIAFYRDQLSEARWGRFQIPQQSPSFDHTASVSNFRPELGKYGNPIRVNTDESTRNAPESGVKRNTSGQPGFY